MLKLVVLDNWLIRNYPVPEKPDVGQFVGFYLVYIEQDRYTSTIAHIPTFSI